MELHREMKKTVSFPFSKVLILIVMCCPIVLLSQDEISTDFSFVGQADGFLHYNPENTFPILFGLRYIPQINYSVFMPKGKLIDFEASSNIYTNVGLKSLQSTESHTNADVYRLWARYSATQTEFRIGLQKINFGSAMLLRPLMWFDHVDPRDPLQLTSGVWGILGRHYFLDNSNVWLWCLYGNRTQRPWDVGITSKHIPEFGGRFQTPLATGEVAVSYHHRKSDIYNEGDGQVDKYGISENRIGLDGKFDVEVGIWFEVSWISKSEKIGLLTNQTFLNIGTDYTFDIGNGLNLILEQLFVATNEKPFQMNKGVAFTALSVSYPLSMNDNLNIVSFFDWNNAASYNFINWKHQFEYFTFYLMTYLNPQRYQLPQQGNGSKFYGGKGIQIMFVYNY